MIYTSRIIKTEWHTQIGGLPRNGALDVSLCAAQLKFDQFGISNEMTRLSDRRTIDSISDFKIGKKFQEIDIYEFRDEIYEILKNYYHIDDGGLQSDLAIWVNSLMRQTIVYEQSPPKRLKISTLTSRSSSVIVGVFLGSGLAGESIPMLILTVPIGIIVVGSAIGIARGLETGLSEVIARALEKTLR